MSLWFSFQLRDLRKQCQRVLKVTQAHHTNSLSYKRATRPPGHVGWSSWRSLFARLLPPLLLTPISSINVASASCVFDSTEASPTRCQFQFPWCLFEKHTQQCAMTWGTVTAFATSMHPDPSSTMRQGGNTEASCDTHTSSLQAAVPFLMEAPAAFHPSSSLPPAPVHSQPQDWPDTTSAWLTPFCLPWVYDVLPSHWIWFFFLF